MKDTFLGLRNGPQTSFGFQNVSFQKLVSRLGIIIWVGIVIVLQPLLSHGWDLFFIWSNLC